MKRQIFKEYFGTFYNYLQKLIEIDSPVGYTSHIADYVESILIDQGLKTERTNKGGIVTSLFGEQHEDSVLLLAHLDTLGAMVSEIKESGRLTITPLGDLNANNIETENVKIITKFNGEYEGTINIVNASIHVNKDYNDLSRTFENIEVILDENVCSKKDVLKLGISVGDIVCIEPRLRVTDSGYIKSRFLDDKISVAALLTLLKYFQDNKVILQKAIAIHFTVCEEVGFGPVLRVAEKYNEIIAVDIGCVGQGLNCTERQVSICAKDCHGPYSYDIVKKFIEIAEKMDIDFAVDVYPYYNSDVSSIINTGVDAKHALIGPGVYASHGYERSHINSINNLLELLYYYLLNK